MAQYKILIGAVIVIALACAEGSAASAQGAFNNWGRCTDTKLAPERREDYCTRLLNSGGGPNSEIAVLSVLGSLHRDKHEYPEAIDSYSRAIGYEALGVSDARQATQAPGSTISIPMPAALVGALEGRAEVYALTGKSDLALADTAHVIRLAPEAANSYAIQCRIRAILKTELDKALGDCDKARKLDPKNSQVLGASGLLQYQLGHLKDAATNFNQVLDVSPRVAGALYMRGIIELHNGNTAAGNSDVTAAKAEDPKIVEKFSDLGIRP